MKLKMILLALALCAMCGLCACGDNGASSSSSASDSGSAAASSSSAASTSSSGEASEGAESGATIDSADLVGNWEIVAMSDGTEVYTLKDADEETRKNIEMKLELNADGSMVLHNMGTDMKGTWSVPSASKVQLDFEDTADFVDISYTATLEDGVLAIEDGGLVMMMEKVA